MFLLKNKIFLFFLLYSFGINATTDVSSIEFLSKEKLNPYIAMIYSKQVLKDKNLSLVQKADIFYQMELYDDVEKLIAQNEDYSLKEIKIRNLIKKGDYKEACLLKGKDERFDFFCQLLTGSEKETLRMWEKYKKSAPKDLFYTLIERILFSKPIKEYDFDPCNIDAMEYFLIRYYQIEEIQLPKNKNYIQKEILTGPLFDDQLIDYDRLIQKWKIRGVSLKTQAKKIQLLREYASVLKLKEKISQKNQKSLSAISVKTQLYPPADIYDALFMMEKGIYSKEIFEIVIKHGFGEILNSWVLEKIK